MLDAMKPLLESDLVNEDTRIAIQEEWEKKIIETREAIRAELREEFAQRFEHDKETMVEALDRMVTDGLTREIKELTVDKKALAEDRVKFQHRMVENSTKFNEFMVVKLAEEIKELRRDRKIQTEGLRKLETFIASKLATEIKEFTEDKRDLVEAKVRLISEAKGKLNSLKENFIKESSTKVKNVVTKRLEGELSQLHEDVTKARENDFGRRIYEAFATEFLTTHLNESQEIRTLQTQITVRDEKLQEAKKAIISAKTLIESKEKEVRVITESNHRSKVMDELLGPLNEDKTEIMRNLLESVQTSRLQGAFEKYLPAVLSNNTNVGSVEKQNLTENTKEVTGNRSKDIADNNNVIDIKRLAGL